MANRKTAEVALRVTGVGELEANMRRAQSSLKITDSSIGHLDQSLKKGNSSARSFMQVASALGASGLPQISSGADVAVRGLSGLFDSIESIKMAQKSLALTALPFAGLAAVSTVAALAIAKAASAWRSYAEAVKLAKEASKDLKEGKQRLADTIGEEAKVLFKMGIATQRELEVMLGTFDSTIEQRKATLEGVRARAGATVRTPFEVARAEAQIELLSGMEREVALIEERYRKQVRENMELTKRQDFSAEELQNLNLLAEQARDQATAELHFKAAAEVNQQLQEERARLAKETAEAAKEEDRAMQSIVSAAQKISAEQKKERDAVAAEKLRQHVMGTNLKLDILGVTANDPFSGEAGRQAALAREQVIHEETLAQLGENHQLIELATMLHQQRLAQIEKEYADKRKAIQDEAVAAVGDMLGAGAQMAQMYGRKGFIAYKAFAIGQAVVATYLGASKALADGDSYSAGFRAAAIIAMGAANVAQIAAQQPPGYREGGYTGDGATGSIAGPVHRREFVFSAPAVANIGIAPLEAMHESGKAGKTGGGDKPMQLIIADRRRQVEDLRTDPNFRTIVLDIMAESMWRFR